MHTHTTPLMAWSQAACQVWPRWPLVNLVALQSCNNSSVSAVAFSLATMRGLRLTQLPAWRYNFMGEALKGQPQATALLEADGPWLRLKRPVAFHVYDLNLWTDPVSYKVIIWIQPGQADSKVQRERNKWQQLHRVKIKTTFISDALFWYQDSMHFYRKIRKVPLKCYAK